MKHNLIVILIMGVALIFVSCSEENLTNPDINNSDQMVSILAKKPAPNLIGPMYLTFNMANFPQVWTGTVTFKEDVLGIRFQSLSKIDVGQTSHFVENFQIYDLKNPDYVYMGGWDAGSLSLANLSGGSLNGIIEVVNAPYEGWLGRRIHIKAALIMGPDGPVACEGIVRIN